ncbi:hypothetical protein BC939DRAFT_85423 [Gamsiella multidivaricata]|uniref:uncharacterized protein n=1 Tax=Gamsiella multidivaricata TaxID=101098 RepID=UPI00221EFCA5|nr:uncharacterized protein BC939DRAFT_85423 [Gamsiella multidivaricata]KAI7827617.1 hypothetical protein BC939DRAFT_85423 [Gamsiella multidivaricata]
MHARFGGSRVSRFVVVCMSSQLEGNRGQHGCIDGSGTRPGGIRQSLGSPAALVDLILFLPRVSSPHARIRIESRLCPAEVPSRRFFFLYSSTSSLCRNTSLLIGMHARFGGSRVSRFVVVCMSSQLEGNRGQHGCIDGSGTRPGGIRQSLGSPAALVDLILFLPRVSSPHARIRIESRLSPVEVPSRCLVLPACPCPTYSSSSRESI